jgi:KDO2-lipid IV(A) lauroyltransferase
MAETPKQDWRGRLFIGLLRFFAWWPLRVNHAMGTAIGYLLWWLPNSPKRISAINLKIAFPDVSETEHRALLKQSLIELGKTTTELGPLWLWSNQKVLDLIQEVEGEELVQAAFDKGKGVIVLSPHIGAWEAMGFYWSSKYPITSLYRPPNLPSIETFMREVRERGSAKLVPTDLSGVKALRKALNQNEMVGILPDQDPGKSGGVYAPFFGHPARTMVLVSRLAAKAQCDVLFTFAERLPKGRGYRLNILPAEAAVADRDEQTAAEALNRGVEVCARRVPAQYQWNYKRYKHPPEGVVDVYKK